MTNYSRRGNCLPAPPPKKKPGEGESGWKTEVGPILNFPYSNLNHRNGYMLVCLFYLVTKGQESQLLPIKNWNQEVCRDDVTRKRPFLQLHTSQDEVLTPTDRLAPPKGCSPWAPHSAHQGQQMGMLAGSYRLASLSSTSRPSSRAQQGYPLLTSTPSNDTIHQPSANPTEGPAWEHLLTKREQHKEQPSPPPISPNTYSHFCHPASGG